MFTGMNSLRWFLGLLLCTIGSGAAEFPGQVDPTFQADLTGIPGTSFPGSMAVGPQQILWVSFHDRIGSKDSRLRRFDSTGRQDPTLVLDTGGGERITRIIPTPDGGAWLGGRFEQLGGIPRIGLARVTPEGQVGPIFGPEAGFTNLQDLTLLSDGGMVVLAGTNFTRLRPDGSVDATFGERANVVFSGGSASPLKLQTLPGDALLMSSGTIWRFLSDGTPDSGFHGGRGELISAPGGGWYSWSSSMSLSSIHTWSLLQRLDPEGQVDPTFQSHRSYDIRTLAMIPDSVGVVVVPSRTDSYPYQHFRLHRLLPDGSRDWGYYSDLGVENGVQALMHLHSTVAAPDDAVMAGVTGMTQHRLVRLRGGRLPPGPVQWMEPPKTIEVSEGDRIGLFPRLLAPGSLHFQWLRDGQPIPGWTDPERTWRSRATDSGVYQLRVRSEAGEFVGPTVTVTVKPGSRFAGSVSSEISTTFEEGVRGTSLLSPEPGIPGSVYALRRAWLPNRGDAQDELVRLGPDGSLDPTFVFGRGELEPPRVTRFCQLGFDSKGRLLVMAQFADVPGTRTSVNRIVRVLADGRLDPTYSGSVIQGATFNSLLVLPDDRVLAAGQVSGSEFNSRERIMRFGRDGTVESGALVESATPLQLIGVQPGGSVIFTELGDGDLAIRRLDPTGAVDSQFQTSTWRQLPKIWVSRAGRILVAPYVGSQPTPPVLVRLTNDGKPDPAFLAPEIIGQGVLAAAEDGQGRWVVAIETEFFSRRPKALRLDADGALDPSFEFASGTWNPRELRRLLIDGTGRVWLGGDLTQWPDYPESWIALNTTEQRPLAMPEWRGDRLTTRLFGSDGANYTVEWTDGLGGGSWQVLETFPGANAVREIRGPAGAVGGWLRVTTEGSR